MSFRSIRASRILLASAAAWLTLGAASQAHAAVYTISDCSDAIPAPEGSFRYYLDIANSNPGSDTIVFAPDDGGCEVTPVAPFVIHDTVWVKAGDPPYMRFRLTTDSQLDDQTLFRIEHGHATLDGLEMFGGESQRGIYVNKSGSMDFRGGRIYGFKNPTSAADPTHVDGGLGGGILAKNNISIQHSYIQHCAADWGGAVAYLPTGSWHSFSFYKSIADYNEAQNQGGAFLLGSQSFATSYYHFDRADIYDNTSGADGGAIYAAYGDMRVKNSTFTGNQTPNFGGAIYQYDGELEVEFSTLVDNSSWGNYGHELRTEGTTVRLDSNIMGFSSTWTGGWSMSCYLSDPPALSVRNVLQESSCSWGSTGNTLSADMGLTGPALYLPATAGDAPPFAFLWMFGLDSTSPALGYGDPSQCGTGAMPADQRGVSRSSSCDAGAFERP